VDLDGLHVDDEVRWHLANALKAILDRNADLLIDALIELGAVACAWKVPCPPAKRHEICDESLPAIHLQKHSESVSSNLGQLFTLCAVIIYSFL